MLLKPFMFADQLRSASAHRAKKIV